MSFGTGLCCGGSVRKLYRNLYLTIPVHQAKHYCTLLSFVVLLQVVVLFCVTIGITPNSCLVCAGGYPYHSSYNPPSPAVMDTQQPWMESDI